MTERSQPDIEIRNRFLRSLLSALLAFWVVTATLSHFFGVQPIYPLAVLGLLYSVQATYYKHELSLNPDYRIPSCRCGGAKADDTEVVLKSDRSAALGVPNSVVGIAAYPTLFYLIYEGRDAPAKLLAVLAVATSAYLAYQMVHRIRALCSLCINVCAVNLWIAWALFR